MDQKRATMTNLKNRAADGTLKSPRMQRAKFINVRESNHLTQDCESIENQRKSFLKAQQVEVLKYRNKLESQFHAPVVGRTRSARSQDFSGKINETKKCMASASKSWNDNTPREESTDWNTEKLNPKQEHSCFVDKNSSSNFLGRLSRKRTPLVGQVPVGLSVNEHMDNNVNKNDDNVFVTDLFSKAKVLSNNPIRPSTGKFEHKFENGGLQGGKVAYTDEKRIQEARDERRILSKKNNQRSFSSLPRLSRSQRANTIATAEQCHTKHVATEYSLPTCSSWEKLETSGDMESGIMGDSLFLPKIKIKSSSLPCLVSGQNSPYFTDTTFKLKESNKEHRRKIDSRNFLLEKGHERLGNADIEIRVVSMEDDNTTKENSGTYGGTESNPEMYGIQSVSDGILQDPAESGEISSLDLAESMESVKGLRYLRGHRKNNVENSDYEKSEGHWSGMKGYTTSNTIVGHTKMIL